LRIVFLLSSADMAGGVRTVATYALHLIRRGHRVTVVSTPSRTPSWRARARSLVKGEGWLAGAARGRSHVDHPQIEHVKLGSFRPIVDADVPDADVVVATWWRTVEWAAALSPSKGAKVHFVQGNDVEAPSQPRERVLAAWRMPFHRIVCSRWLQDLIRVEHGDPDASYVPNGVDLEQFSTPPRGKQAHPTVGLVYAEMALKGCDLALAAIGEAARRLPGLRLVAFGNEGNLDGLPLPAGATFVRDPPQDRIPGLYASSDVWLWPSRREGFGLPILEAMACRTPVIATPAGAAPEILAQGGGELLSAAEPGPMAEVIVRLCSLPEAAWRTLSDRARLNAEAHGWERSIPLFEEALELAVRRERERGHPARH
jgi:glycosyltransferase involved in cell wall biosynthesis